MVNRGPPPVRSLQHIYGLPSNSPEEQQQADVGTLLASRSVEIIGTILKDQRKRRVPQAGTLENPPGSDTKEEGPAWELPGVKTFMEVFEGKVADYNTCAYQEEERVRWYKPGRWAGCLLDLDRLSRTCTCGQWIRHEPLVGAKRTSLAAQYPKKLCEEYCKLIITAFKHTLQLEYLLEEQADHQDGRGLRAEEEVAVEQREDLSRTSRRKTGSRPIEESLGADAGDAGHSAAFGSVEEGQTRGGK